ncbi:MAG TPA: hypothetical protein VN442_05785, partial [Bryobacteraceae bacterium]|nr:hypothetical protein [Bryobacteraceae bacterium]
VARSRQITLRLPPGEYTATWRDTRSGANLQREDLSGSVEIPVRLSSPVYAEDIALIVRASRTR